MAQTEIQGYTHCDILVKDISCIKEKNNIIARMAELVYAHDLKSCLARDVGSTPTPGTHKTHRRLFLF